MPDKRPSGDRVDARRVEAACRAWVRGEQGKRMDAAIAAADEAVGGVVSRETADALAEAAANVLNARFSSRFDAITQALDGLAFHLAAYRRDAS